MLPTPYYRLIAEKEEKLEELKKIPGAKKEVSIILPTYNEVENIELLINKIKKELKGINFEIIVVDDDSKDGTAKIIDKIANDTVIAFHRYNKKGILSAIQDGTKICRGEYIVMMDSDFSHPPKMIKEFWRLRNKYDIVSGSRFSKGGSMEASFLRKYGSFLINKVCALVIGLKIKDIAGGFHLIKKESFEKIKFKYKVVFGEFDLELLYRARQLKFKIKEIPFIYKFREKGSSKIRSSNKIGSSNIFSLMKLALLYFKRAIQLRLSN